MLAQLSLKKYLAISSGLHFGIGLLAIIITSIVFYKSESLKKENILLLESSVRVDMVAMPTMTVKELKNLNLSDTSVQPKGEDIAPAKKESEEPAKPDDIVLKKETEKKNFKSFLKDLGEQASLKVNKEAKNGSKTGLGLNQESREDLKNLVLAGNKLSAGQSTTQGEIGSATQGEFAAYLWSLPDHVRGFWMLPSYLKGKSFKCRIRIFLGKDGSILKTEVYESSGSSEYDDRATDAVVKASPFPSPPSALVARVLRGDIVLGFPL